MLIKSEPKKNRLTKVPLQLKTSIKTCFNTAATIVDKNMCVGNIYFGQNAGAKTNEEAEATKLTNRS